MTSETLPEVIDPKSLPEPHNDGAAMVVNAIGRLLPGLPSFVDRDQFANALVVAANEGDLSACLPKSILMAAYGCCRLGLMPGKVLGHAHFIPFRDKKRNVTECQLIIGYRGYLDMASRNRHIAGVHTEVVCAGEEFTRWVDEHGAHFRHDIPLERDLSSKSIVGAYAVAQLAGGGHQFRYVTKAEIDKASRDTDPWKYAFAEMAMKTAIRRSAKQWRLSPELALALHLDEQAELGAPQQIDGMPLLDAPDDGRKRSLLPEPADEPPAPDAQPGETHGQTGDQNLDDLVDPVGEDELY